MTARSDWFAKHSAPHAAFRLICFPHAGGGTATYAAWGRYLPDVELWVARLPGRENRLHEEPYHHLPPLIRYLADALPANPDRPVLFFGHSMGALISFELARELRRRDLPQPAHLFVSGRRAPHVPDIALSVLGLPAAEFVAHVGRLGGTPVEILQDPELCKLILPALRADFSVCDTYTYTDEPPLTSGVTALGGREDTEEPPDVLASWREQTTGHFSRHVFPGDHFFVFSARSAVLGVMADEIAHLRSISPLNRPRTRQSDSL